MKKFIVLAALSAFTLLADVPYPVCPPKCGGKKTVSVAISKTAHRKS